MVLLPGDDPGGRECCSPPTGKQPLSRGLQLPRFEGARAEHGNDVSSSSLATQADGNREEEEEDYEVLEDFLELPDTRSIASDDSFYPPLWEVDDDEDDWSLGDSEPDSPEPISFFYACCTNNAVVLRALVRQGPKEDEVRETDRNKRVRGWGAGNGWVKCSNKLKKTICLGSRPVLCSIPSPPHFPI